MSLKSKVYLIIEKLLAPAADKIVCISEAEKTSALKSDVADVEKLELIPNGIDVQAVRMAIAKSRKEWHRRICLYSRNGWSCILSESTRYLYSCSEVN